MCLCLCLRGVGDAGLLALCFLDIEVGEDEGDRARRLRSLPGDRREEDLEEKAGDGERRRRGGEGVYWERFLCGERDLRLPRGDLLRDLRNNDFILLSVEGY